MEKEIFLIRTIKDLEGLPIKPLSLVHTSLRLNITIKLPDLDPGSRSTYEKQLTTAYAECGCVSGSIFGLLSLAAYIVSLFVGLEYPFGVGVIILLGFLIPFAAMAIGKILGLSFAIARIKRTKEEIYSLLELEPELSSARV